jgi:hypothetical protein
MTAIRRVTFRTLGGIAGAISFALPAFAQNSDAPVDVTAAPPPSSDTIGPSQLQNFNLQGTVTRPADRPVPIQPAPTTSTPAQPQSAGPATNDRSGGQAEVRPTGNAANAARAVTPAQPALPSSAAQPVPTAVTTPSSPAETLTDPVQPSEVGAATAPAGSTLPWPWLAALLALIAGGGFIAWSRRGKNRRYGDPGRMAFAGLAADTDTDAPSIPPVHPRPDPVPPRAQPAPRPDPVPPPAPNPAPIPRVDDGLVKSTALKPELNFQFLPDRAVVTEREVMLQFDVVLTNSGAAPARDVLVEAKLVPAHANQDREIAAFFERPQATGDRMAGIPPLGKVSLKSAVRLPLDQLHSFEVDGRKLFVPLVAFNILFRGGGGEGQASASFLVGRGTDGDEKLAPFRLDLGPRIFRGLSSRPHSMGLAR